MKDLWSRERKNRLCFYLPKEKNDQYDDAFYIFLKQVTKCQVCSEKIGFVWTFVIALVSTSNQDCD